MTSRTQYATGWLLTLACLIAAIVGFAGRKAAYADAVTLSTAPQDKAGHALHGLSPVPGDQVVPPAWLPPGSTDPDTGPSDVVFPPQRMTLRFNHSKHLKEAGTTCVTCHSKAKTSKSAEDSLLPVGTTCDACHDSDHTDLANVKGGEDAMSKCAFCHLGYRAEDGNQVARIDVPRPNLRFSHQAHVTRNIACAQCHGSVEEIELATRDQLPRMKGCFNCHNMGGASQGEAQSACDTCHVSLTDGRMKTMFASGELKPPRWLHNAQHTPDFIETHKRVAADDSTFCASCHQENFCTDCHDGKVRPRQIHPNDWISMHPMAARQDSPRCTSCHREQSFCIECHQRAGITASGPNRPAGAFHPPGWADVTARGPGHHSWEAQRNLSACVSCHTERDCTKCHAAADRGGFGANPHPANWAASCSGASRRNPRPCLVCHQPGSADMAMCQ